jgi:mRNA-degrading endonuclease RelE of RelBE toxin-antitoxin system
VNRLTRFELTTTAVKDYVKAPAEVRRAFDKQTRFLVNDLQHPSLNAKKYDEFNGVWQARVNRAWRFYFTIADDTYVIHKIIPHPK